MKKTYTKPEIDITAFTTEDIITSSSVGMNVNDEKVGGTYKIDAGVEDGWID